MSSIFLTAVRWNLLRLAPACQVVKSGSATVRVPELDFEIPPGTQKGSITTVEGLLSDAAEALRALQPERTAADPAQARAKGLFHTPTLFPELRALPFIARSLHVATLPLAC